MKRHINFFLFLLVAFSAFAQNCDMPLQVALPEQAEPLDYTSESQIYNKLLRIASQNGVAGGQDYSPFALTATVDVADKEIISSSPAKYIYVLNVNLFIVDTYDKKIYSSTSVEVRCAGNSQTKAYISGIKQLSPTNRAVQTFIQQGKKKLLDYYNNNYQTIIKRAKTQATLRNYEEAISILMAIPECCNGYDLAMAEVGKVFQQFVDRQCEENLAQAQAAWMSGFTKENAAVASIFLSEIYPDAACYSTAQELVREIKKHMGEEWRFELKRWDDAVSIEKQRMTYAREIALAFAQNQPREVINFLVR